jgi:hypothetical protein
MVVMFLFDGGLLEGFEVVDSLDAVEIRLFVDCFFV